MFAAKRFCALQVPRGSNFEKSPPRVLETLFCLGAPAHLFQCTREIELRARRFLHPSQSLEQNQRLLERLRGFT